MREYRVKITVKNNLLLSAIEAAGYKTQTEFARAAELRVGDVNALVALRAAPIDSHLGTFTLHASKIMEALGAAPTDLWTSEQLNMKLKRNSSETMLAAPAIHELLESNAVMMTLPDPEDSVYQGEVRAIIGDMLKTMTSREADILRKRSGFGARKEMTFQEIADEYGLSHERVMQIQEKAFRKLRHPSRGEPLRVLLDELSGPRK